jgi:hypothetical protein
MIKSKTLKPMNPVWFLPASLIFVFLSAHGILNAQTEDNPWHDKYEKNCFCKIGQAHPESILEMDNNYKVLFELNEKKTIKDLQNSGTNHTESQLFLMEQANLIGKKDSFYYSRVPIITTKATQQLRDKSKSIGNALYSKILNEFKELQRILQEQNFQNYLYAIFASYILDNPWSYLQKNQVIDKRKLTKENPFWDGLFWMIKPKRNFSWGTNSLSSGNYTMSVLWSHQAGVSVENYGMLWEFLQDYKANNNITRPEILSNYTKKGLINSSGKLQIPVIEEDSTDLIYRQKEKIISVIGHYLRDEIDYSNILSEYPVLKRNEKIIILYHEVMWNMLHLMEKRGLIKKPIAFRKPDKAESKDMKSLIFIVKKN